VVGSRRNEGSASPAFIASAGARRAASRAGIHAPRHATAVPINTNAAIASGGSVNAAPPTIIARLPNPLPRWRNISAATSAPRMLSSPRIANAPSNVASTPILMESWAIVAYLTVNAMTVAMRGVVLQCQKEEKARQLIKYVKCLYSQQPQWLQDAYPLSKPLHSQSDLSCHWAKGGYVVGIPGGADQMRSHHPWAVFNDESSFQPDAGECYNEYLAAGPEKIIFASSAGPGWYADARHDIVVNQ